MRTIILAVLLVLLPVLVTRGSRPPVVLISIDGLKPDYLLRADEYGLRIPNLRRLLREGAHAEAVTGVLPTVTYPSHTTLVSGVSPASHGITANTPFDPLARNQGGWYWYAEDIRVPTLWDACAGAGLRTASVDWPVTVGARIDFNIVQMWRAGTADDRKLIRALSTPGLLTEAEQAIGPYPEGYDYTVRADLRRAAFNAWLLETKRPRLLTTYFAGLDEVEHAHGPDSPEALSALEEIDGAVGIVRAAAQRAGGGEAFICVVSDHGFLPTTSEIRLNVALREAGLITIDERGRVSSWRAMVWNSGGSGAVMLHDPTDEEARRKVRATLRQLSEASGSALTAVYEGEEIARRGGFPGAAFVVGTKPGYYLGGGFEPPLTRAIAPGGGHGFLPSLAAMDSSFFIAGRGITPGRNLGRIDMRDIAPTLASLLGVSLPGAEGRDLLRRQ